MKRKLILLGCMLIQAVPFAIASNTQPQFMSYVTEGEGFSLMGFSLLFTIGTLIAAFSAPLIGKLYTKMNVKLLFLIGALLSGLGFLSFSFAQTLMHFYIIAGITQIGTSIISSIGIPLLINEWFDGSVKGKVLGIAFSGGSIGNIFLQQFVSLSLLNYGYKTSYIIFGLLSLSVGIPVALFIMRMPKDTEKPIPLETSTPEATGFTLKEAMKLPLFWLFGSGFILVGIYIAALAVQYPTYFRVALDMDSITIGKIASLFALFALGGNLVGGVLFDKLGNIKTILIAGILALIACLSLIIAPMNTLFTTLFAITQGVSVFIYMMGPAYMTGKLFGRKEYAAILGVISLMFAIGFSMGAVVFGVLVEQTTYTIAWSAMLGVILVAYSLLGYSNHKLLQLQKR